MVVHIFTRVFRIFYCAKSIDWAVSARARNWCNNAVTYGQTAAKKRVARMTKQQKYVEEATKRRTMFGRARILLHPHETFFYILIGWMKSWTV